MTAPYQPIEPGPITPVDVANLRSQWLQQASRFRVLVSIYLIVGAWGGLSGGVLLTHAYSNWLTWLVSLFILEPIGVACLAAFVFIHWPNSSLGIFLSSALQRAKFVALFLGILFVGGIVSAIAYLLVQLWRFR